MAAEVLGDPPQIALLLSRGRLSRSVAQLDDEIDLFLLEPLGRLGELRRGLPVVAVSPSEACRRSAGRSPARSAPWALHRQTQTPRSRRDEPAKRSVPWRINTRRVSVLPCAECVVFSHVASSGSALQPTCQCSRFPITTHSRCVLMAAHFYPISRDEIDDFLTDLGFVPLSLKGVVELVYAKIVRIRGTRIVPPHSTPP